MPKITSTAELREVEQDINRIYDQRQDLRSKIQDREDLSAEDIRQYREEYARLSQRLEQLEALKEQYTPEEYKQIKEEVGELAPSREKQPTPDAKDLGAQGRWTEQSAEVYNRLAKELERDISHAEEAYEQIPEEKRQELEERASRLEEARKKIEEEGKDYRQALEESGYMKTMEGDYVKYGPELPESKRQEINRVAQTMEKAGYGPSEITQALQEKYGQEAVERKKDIDFDDFTGAGPSRWRGHPAMEGARPPREEDWGKDIVPHKGSPAELREMERARETEVSEFIDKLREAGATEEQVKEAEKALEEGREVTVRTPQISNEMVRLQAKYGATHDIEVNRDTGRVTIKPKDIGEVEKRRYEGEPISIGQVVGRAGESERFQETQERIGDIGATIARTSPPVKVASMFIGDQAMRFGEELGRFGFKAPLGTPVGMYEMGGAVGGEAQRFVNLSMQYPEATAKFGYESAKRGAEFGKEMVGYEGEVTPEVAARATVLAAPVGVGGVYAARGRISGAGVRRTLAKPSGEALRELKSGKLLSEAALREGAETYSPSYVASEVRGRLPKERPSMRYSERVGGALQTTRETGTYLTSEVGGVFRYRPTTPEIPSIRYGERLGGALKTTRETGVYVRTGLGDMFGYRPTAPEMPSIRYSKMLGETQAKIRGAGMQLRYGKPRPDIQPRRVMEALGESPYIPPETIATRDIPAATYGPEFTPYTKGQIPRPSFAIQMRAPKTGISKVKSLGPERYIAEAETIPRKPSLAGDVRSVGRKYMKATEPAPERQIREIFGEKPTKGKPFDVRGGKPKEVFVMEPEAPPEIGKITEKEAPLTETKTGQVIITEKPKARAESRVKTEPFKITPFATKPEPTPKPFGEMEYQETRYPPQTEPLKFEGFEAPERKLGDFVEGFGKKFEDFEETPTMREFGKKLEAGAPTVTRGVPDVPFKKGVGIGEGLDVGDIGRGKVEEKMGVMERGDVGTMELGRLRDLTIEKPRQKSRLLGMPRPPPTGPPTRPKTPLAPPAKEPEAEEPREPLKFKWSKKTRKAEVTPLADWFAVTFTQAKYGTATVERPKKRTQYMKKLGTIGMGISFPTAEIEKELKSKKGKKNDKSLFGGVL